MRPWLHDGESRWLFGLGLAFAVAIGAFGIWLWVLILSGPAR